MVSSRDLEVRLRANISDLESQLGKANAQIERLSASSKAATPSFLSLSSAVAVGEAAFHALTLAVELSRDAFIGIIEAASEAEDSQIRLEAAWRASGNAAGVSVDQLNDWAKSLQDSTTASDEEVRAAEAVFLTFRNIGGASMRETLDLTISLSKFWDTDLVSAARAVGLAMNDPLEGLSRLSRQGVVFTNQQQEQIKTLVESGRGLEAQRIILDRLQGAVGSVAEAMAGAASGEAKQFKNAINDLEETLGAAATQGFKPLLDRMLEWARSNDAKNFAEDLATDIGNIATKIDSVVTALQALRDFGPIKILLETSGNGLLVGAAAAAATGHWEIAGLLLSGAGAAAVGTTAGNAYGNAQAVTYDMFGKPIAVPNATSTGLVTPQLSQPGARRINDIPGDADLGIGGTAAAEFLAARALGTGANQFNQPSGGGGGAKGPTATAYSSATLGLIDQILSGIPAAFQPGALDQTALTQYQQQADAYASIRKSVNMDLAQLGLNMADLDARGQELTPEFAAMKDRADGLKSALQRVDLIESLRLTPFKDAIQQAGKLLDDAAAAQKRYNDQLQQAGLGYISQLASQGVTGFGPGVFENILKTFGLPDRSNPRGSTVSGEVPTIKLSGDLVLDGVQ